MGASERRPWRPQFGLRTLLLAIVVTAVAMAAWRWQARRHAREVSAARQLSSDGRGVFYHRAGPQWLRTTIGDRWFENFDYVAEVSVPIFAEAPRTSRTLGEFRGRLDTFDDADMARLRPLLAEFPHLRRLSIASEALTDEGLLQLAGLTQLEVLDLRCTEISEAGIERLHRALPRLKIYDD